MVVMQASTASNASNVHSANNVNKHTMPTMQIRRVLDASGRLGTTRKLPKKSWGEVYFSPSPLGPPTCRL